MDSRYITRFHGACPNENGVTSFTGMTWKGSGEDRKGLDSHFRGNDMKRDRNNKEDKLIY